ncbi:AAA family ATPase [Limobrevibacterium gyesilva]|uniref:non-specific protein-tyrosine kinase n=1 Tax=Limobrevibacterium gyesilva TaxID=2991712 RepID=A0AA41YN28_9PROT|nr:AAA family ATPase [Limobrevibacterium gyesilva]MCW3476916.1 AAA family ATPase [Limobrevibacterium gyesilva]
MSSDPSHLVERVAERLRGVGGLTAPEPAPERDIRRVVRREVERKPAPHRPAPPDDALAPGSLHADDLAPDAATTGGDAAGQLPHAVPVDLPGDDGGADSAQAVVDTARRAPPVTADGNTALAVPEVPRLPPLDMASLEKAGLVVGHKVRTRISEEFRITVGHILRSMHANYSPGRGAPNVIMVTSARPGEGKTFSSLNLAGSIAQHTQREVLLVDVDAKQRSISAELGLADRSGLLDLSTNTSLRIEDVIIRTAIPHLSIIAIGSGHTVGMEISPTRPVTTLIERIARRFPNAVVLLDAPPCLSTSDPSTLAPFVGQIVMVVEAERTQRNEIVAALDLVKACPSVTLMLNKIRLTTSYTFGAYHYFGTYS